MKATAFVSGSAFLPRTGLQSPPSAISVASPQTVTAAPSRQRARVVRMSIDENKKIPQGFTSYSELLNGRAAMVAFVAALGAEILNPSHPTVVEQLASIYTTIAHLI